MGTTIMNKKIEQSEFEKDLREVFKRKTHELKIELYDFEAIQQGVKTFEIRFNDRGYTVGDYILFLDKYFYEITYITKFFVMLPTIYEQQKYYVVMAIKPINEKDLKTYYYE